MTAPYELRPVGCVSHPLSIARPHRNAGWDGTTLLVATPSSSPTSCDLQATGKVGLGIGPTRDLVLIEGTAPALTAIDFPDQVGDAFAAKTGFDPRQLSDYLYFPHPTQRLQAWREASELKDRDLMRAGHWLVPG